MGIGTGLLLFGIGSDLLSFSISLGFLGIPSLMLGCALITLKRWGWLLVNLLCVSHIIESVAAISIEGKDFLPKLTITVIQSLIIYYLFRPKVRYAFNIDQRALFTQRNGSNHREFLPENRQTASAHPMMSACHHVTQWTRKAALFITVVSWVLTLVLQMNIETQTRFEPGGFWQLLWASVPFLLLLGLNLLPLWFWEALVSFIGTLFVGAVSVSGFVTADPDLLRKSDVAVADLVNVGPLILIIFVVLMVSIIILIRFGTLAIAGIITVIRTLW